MNRQKKTNRLLTLMLTVCLLAPCGGAVSMKAGREELKGSLHAVPEAMAEALALLAEEGEIPEAAADGREAAREADAFLRRKC